MLAAFHLLSPPAQTHCGMALAGRRVQPSTLPATLDLWQAETYDLNLEDTFHRAASALRWASSSA